MARIIQESESLETTTTKIQNRTWRVEVYSDINKNSYEIIFHREQVTYINNIIVGIKILPDIKRNLNDVLSEQVTAAGATITIGQLAALVAAAGDAWEEQDEEITEE